MSSSSARHFPGILGATKLRPSETKGLGVPETEADEPATRLASTVAVVCTNPDISHPRNPDSDEDLVAFLCTGDNDALTILFKRHARVVRGIAYRILRDPSEADDLLQDIFLLIHRVCVNFDPSKGSARAWILQMTYRRAISRRRFLTSRHFYSHQQLDDFAAILAGPNAVGQFENTLEGTLGKKDFEELFQELSGDQRQALLLRFVEGYTVAEIAEKLGQSRANIKNHYFRGLEKLRKHLFSGKLTGKRAL